MFPQRRTNCTSASQPLEIYENLHVRHLTAIYGRETLLKLPHSKILISGMQGLGAELAKNLVLAGFKFITLHDEGTVELWDLSGSLAFSEEDLKKNKAVASVQKLQEINNSVIISTITTELTKEKLSDFQVVVFTDICLEKAIEYDDYCHKHQPPIAFIKSEVRGLFGSMFCDFGPKFKVLGVAQYELQLDNYDDKEHTTGIIVSISNTNRALVDCVDDKKLMFKDGDEVLFSEVKGMTELNDGKPRKIQMNGPYSFHIEEDTTNYAAYKGGGIATIVRKNIVLSFKTLRQAIKDPAYFTVSHMNKDDHSRLMHLAFQALDKFRVELRRFPLAGSREDAQKLIDILTEINGVQPPDGMVKEIDEELIRKFASGARAVLIPMAAIFGGIVGQEVMKACSGRFQPIFQFLYFDSSESLPSEPLDPNDLMPLNCRYDAQISVFGSKLQKKLQKAKVFIVGHGASGCEFLKNVSLMGLCCGDRGKLTITDEDFFEKSNLSTQFLFRDRNIGRGKSWLDASAASLINPRIHFEALPNSDSHETENVFDDTFWENLSVVISAVSNENAKQYIYKRCFYFQKALLLSRSFGATGEIYMVLPYLTEGCGTSFGTFEKQPLGFLVDFFPYNITHCLAWARSKFEGVLERIPTEVNAYLSNPSEYISSMKSVGDEQTRETLEQVLECLGKAGCCTAYDCIDWARLRFEDYFVNEVKQLTHTFPEHLHTNGKPFWSEPKQFPHPIQFSSDDSSHFGFIRAASYLRANTFGILLWLNAGDELGDIADEVVVPAFEPKNVQIVIGERGYSLPTILIDDANVINQLAMQLEALRKELPPNFRMRPIQFETENPFHMNLIIALANMRAQNYNIPEINIARAKFILERTYPAAGTSAAVAAGLGCLELYKFVDGRHQLADYQNSSVNLDTPYFTMWEPVSSVEIKHRRMSWSEWDRWKFKDPTLRQLLQRLKEKKIEVFDVFFGRWWLYGAAANHEYRMDKKLVDLVKAVSKSKLPPGDHFDIEVICNVKIPTVSIYYF